MTTAPVRPGPSTSSGGPASSLPTLEQLLILVARAERKGGLDPAEGARLRAGIQYLAARQTADPSADVAHIDELRRKYNNARKTAWKLKRKVVQSAGPGVEGPESDAARAALRRVAELAQRWTHIPAKRQAGVSVLAAIRNGDAA
ncbi:hypothetical protein ACPCTG_31660 [Streptomyces pseudogriseolus]|uniref:hypothetical protein n=1 Tax=Streptomyces pseudogriseolus TaxID=36817 RepID=UPI003FA25FF4